MGKTNPLLPWFDKAFEKMGLAFNDCYHIGFVGSQNNGKTRMVGIMRAFVSSVVSLLAGGAGANANAPAEALRLLPPEVVEEVLRTAKALVQNDPANQPGSHDDVRVPTPWRMGETNIIIWDLPGGGTNRQPVKGYVARMGVRYMSTIVLVVGDNHSDVSNIVIRDLNMRQLFPIVIQTKADILIHAALREFDLLHDDEDEVPPADFAATVLERRKADLREEYALETRESGLRGWNPVFCVNLMPSGRRGDAISQATYELDEALPYIVNHARRMHEPPAEGEDPAGEEAAATGNAPPRAA